MIFDASGVALNYRLEGMGTRPLICVHGVGSYLEAWDGVVRGLDPDFRILRFDLRGHGQSMRVKGRYEIGDFVGDLLALADHAGFAEFDLAGFSLGGLITQRTALDHPQRVKRLVLISTVAGRNDEEQARVTARLEALTSSDRGSHYDASMNRWFTEAFQKGNPALMQSLRARNAANDPECYAAAYRVLAETDLGPELKTISCPTLIMTGEEDQGSNPRMARFMHDQIAGSKLAILPGLRHSILQEAPDQVAAHIRNFLMAGEMIMDKKLQEAGEKIRRQVLGDDYVDRVLANADDFSAPMQNLLNEYCWGQCWTDDSLDLKQRSLLNLGMLAALGRMHEFKIHFRGAVRNGLTEKELSAALIQIAVYCGVPAAVESFRIAREVRAEMAAEAKGKSE